MRLLGRGAHSVVAALWRLVRPVGLFSFRWLLVAPYGVLLRYQRKLRALVPNVNLVNLLRYHQVVLYLALGGAVLVIINNHTIQNTEPEEFGQRNLLFPLVQTSEEIGPLNDLPAPGDIGAPPGEGIPLPAGVPYVVTESGTAILKPLLVTTRPGIAGRTHLEYYTVQPGDTLSSIASRFQLSLATLLWENRLTQNSTLRIGQPLTILPTNGITYRVGRGDTVASIAKRFGVSVNDIASFNQLGGKLVVGSTIVVPGGRPLPPPPAPRPAPTPAPIFAIPSPAPTRSSTRLQWPTVRRRITQYFTWRHPAVDIGDSVATPIYAAEAGVVQVAGWNRGGYGYYIIIDHGGGLQTLYAHNTKLRVTVGDRVERGQQIADMGSTGRSTGPHLHFEVRVQGRRVNPLTYTR